MAYLAEFLDCRARGTGDILDYMIHNTYFGLKWGAIPLFTKFRGKVDIATDGEFPNVIAVVTNIRTYNAEEQMYVDKKVMINQVPEEEIRKEWSYESAVFSRRKNAFLNFGTGPGVFPNFWREGMMVRPMEKKKLDLMNGEIMKAWKEIEGMKKKNTYLVRKGDNSFS